MSNQVQVVNGEIQIATDVLQGLKEYQIAKKQNDKIEKEIKKQVLKAMQENGIKSFENDVMKITLVEETTRASVDTQALKDDGLYLFYLKESKVKEHLKVTYK